MKFLEKFKTQKIRITLLIATIIASLLTVFLGTGLYTAKNYKTSGEYGGSGAVTIKVTKKNGNLYSNDELHKIYSSIIKHIDPLGNNGIANNSSIMSGGLITFKKSGIKSQEELNTFAKFITNKPKLGLYSTGGQALMKKGTFGVFTTSMPKDEEEAAKLDRDFQVPFLENQAIADTQQGQSVVRIKLKKNAITQWSILTSVIAQKKANIVMWMDYQQLRRKMFEKNMITSSENIFSSIHAKTPDNKPSATLAKNVFKLNGLNDPESYLISTVSVKKALRGQEFVITLGNDKNSFARAKELAEKINYGTSSYLLSLKSSMFTPAEYGSNAFHKAMIAGLIVFSLIAIFMVFNYGLLGVLATIGMSLYMFLTLTMFTVMRGEYSPETIASLIIGIGMAVDACIITFERLKSEVKNGNSIMKSNKTANKLSLSTIFDSNTTTIIVGFILFYFGTSQIKGFSIMLILSIIFTLLVMLLFVRIAASLLVNSGVLKNRTWLVGVKNKKIKTSATSKKIINFNYVKNSKWFVIASTAIIASSVVMFGVFAGASNKLSSGFNSSIEFAGGSKYVILNSQSQNLTSAEAKQIKDQLIANGVVKTEDIKIIYQDTSKTLASVKIETKSAIPQSKIFDAIKFNKLKPTKYQIVGGSVTAIVAQKLIKDALIAIIIALVAIVIYTLIRFKWTYSVAAIIALVHDGLIVTAVFIISRIQFSPIFVAGLLSVIGYSINDTIVTFDRVREKMRNHKEKLEKESIRKIANSAIKDTIKRSLLTSLTTITAVATLLFFGNATKLEFNIAMLVGLISGTYSSIFIATYVWVLLETKSQKRSEMRKKKGFWKLKEKEEQVVVGINDFVD